MPVKPKKQPGPRVASTAQSVPGVSERVVPGQLASNCELMNGLGAFVGDDTLEIEHIADGHVLGADAGLMKALGPRPVFGAYLKI
jgi:hypothetical protein